MGEPHSEKKRLESTMSRSRILIVDDEPAIVKILQTAVTTAGYEALAASTAEDALESIQQTKIDLMISDLRLGKGMNGIELIKHARQYNHNLQSIMITAYGTIEVAVDAMKHGAFDFICKPFEIKELMDMVEAALECATTANAVNGEKNAEVQTNIPRHFGTLIGDSEAMQRVYRLIERVAPTETTVLIQGESGTGKELVARAIHNIGKRAANPWVALNCAAIPGTLLESEMFGHKAGSFTGAGKNDRQGLFSTAHGGTLFLDEIGVMDLALQGKLLRALQEGKVRPVGANKDIDVDVRVLAATNENMEEQVRSGEFREDLFYRINVIPINLPPLRDRKEDIPLLALFFSQVQSRSLGFEVSVTEEALDVLRNYKWPGNVRELQNAIACAATLSDHGRIAPRDLPPRILAESEEIKTPTSSTMDELDTTQTSLKDFLRQKEQEYINSVLRKTGGNRAKAADLLGISRATFYRKYGNE